MKPLWETSLKVRAFDVDANNRLKVSTIFDYFQDAASLHADNLKVGYDDLIPKGYFWVMSWAKFEFHNYPKFKDEVKVQTWGKKQHKLYSVRDFLMLDNDDEVLCKATTAWLFLDAKSLRPKIMPQLFPDVIFLEEKSAIDDLPQKFQNIPQTESMYSKELKYSDIDLNKHTNNAKYVELLLDSYDQEFHNSHPMKSLTISFLSETKFADTIEILKSNDAELANSHFVEAKNLKTRKTVFQAMVNWK
jgi:medium-chain acyl-[acyl-carrier-protein] hydrolase